NNQWNFVARVRQLELVFNLIPDDEQPAQPGVNIEPVNSHRVVVIPERRGILAVGVEVSRGFAGRIPVLRITVTAGRSPAAMQMDHSAHLRFVAFGAMQSMIDWQKMARR